MGARKEKLIKTIRKGVNELNRHIEKKENNMKTLRETNGFEKNVSILSNLGDRGDVHL